MMQNFFGFLFDLDWLFLVTFAVFGATAGLTVIGQAVFTRPSPTTADELGRTTARSPGGN